MTPVTKIAEENIRAEALARLLHYGQVTRSEGMDYANHLEAVAEQCTGEDQAVAWLHDALEDTPVRPEQLIAAGIRTSTIETVLVLTRKGAEETYDEYITRVIQSGDEAAVRVKIADLTHNLRPGCPDGLRKRYMAAMVRLKGDR